MWTVAQSRLWSRISISVIEPRFLSGRIQLSSAVPFSASLFFAPVLSQYSLPGIRSKRNCSLVGAQASWRAATEQSLGRERQFHCCRVCVHRRGGSVLPWKIKRFWGPVPTRRRHMLPDWVGSYVYAAQACRSRLQTHREPHLPAEPYKGLWLGWGLGGEGD